jgi:hypothetical protein
MDWAQRTALTEGEELLSPLEETGVSVGVNKLIVMELSPDQET